MRRLLRIRVRSLVVLGLATVLLLGVGGVLGLRAPAPAAVTGEVVPRVDRLAVTIDRAQEQLRRVPGDHRSWAALGLAYLEKSRITADPSWFGKAEGALRRSLAVRPDGNDPALAGLGALANARHDFAGAARHARQALRMNPYSAEAYAVLADAETQLGRADAATEAVQHLLDLRPGLTALTRAAYDREQRGRISEATALLRRALDTALDPADVAFCRYQLGELAWNAGDLAGAEREYAAGSAADPGYLPLLQGRAKVAAARGRPDQAVAGYADLTARSPTPGYLLEYADLLDAAGRPAEADAQRELAHAAHQLFTANGGTDALTGAALALARSRPAEALTLARREWQRRQFAEVADLLGWALHANGRHAEALGYARRAESLGARNARYAYHLGMIELALGDRAAARRDLGRALDVNPHFSTLDAPAAARALAGLGSV
ncbi:tetratricopeptide repeat protein [Plantactinospora sp. KLBMP9567]|uniref:tetratricopeptide repeat protein n=1 Tax=Plantactinospora sp. KLBMP9567 TaxID=3085900 RepID=UPI002981B906|nr:tetratricopeptide repeat protein [Plantactinospora sp. KLBMP9567]MDW5326611.1 tetratricopeptide repeat protein [Plantactinospora sp. KLBMP9567]